MGFKKTLDVIIDVESIDIYAPQYNMDNWNRAIFNVGITALERVLRDVRLSQQIGIEKCWGVGKRYIRDFYRKNFTRGDFERMFITFKEFTEWFNGYVEDSKKEYNLEFWSYNAMFDRGAFEENAKREGVEINRHTLDKWKCIMILAMEIIKDKHWMARDGSKRLSTLFQDKLLKQSTITTPAANDPARHKKFKVYQTTGGKDHIMVGIGSTKKYAVGQVLTGEDGQHYKVTGHGKEYTHHGSTVVNAYLAPTKDAVTITKSLRHKKHKIIRSASGSAFDRLVGVLKSGKHLAKALAILVSRLDNREGHTLLSKATGNTVFDCVFDGRPTPAEDIMAEFIMTKAEQAAIERLEKSYGCPVGPSEGYGASRDWANAMNGTPMHLEALKHAKKVHDTEQRHKEERHKAGISIPWQERERLGPEAKAKLVARENQLRKKHDKERDDLENEQHRIESKHLAHRIAEEKAQQGNKSLYAAPEYEDALGSMESFMKAMGSGGCATDLIK